MAPTKKTTRKKKSDGPRSKKYGCVTYNSEPQDNPDCRKGRCSPPARMTSQDGTTKVTQIRYRRRNLDVVSRNCACSLKPASKTKKSTGSKTRKAPAKPKAPVKSKAPAKPKTVKAPTVNKTASKVKAPAKPKAPAKAKAKAPSIAPVMPKLSEKDMEFLTKTIEEKGKKAVKEFGERLDKAKAPAKAPTPPAARGISGKFDAGKLKAIAQFLHRLDKSLDMPIFSNDSQFVDQNKIMAVRLVSRMPGKSFVGLPLEPSLKDLAVPMDSLIKRLDKDVIDVAYRDGRLYYNWNSPGLSVSTAVHESNNTRINRFTFTRSSVQGDTKFRTTQSRFQDDVKKAVQSIEGKLPTRYDSYKDTALAMCSPKGTVSYTDKIPEKCAGYSAYFLNIIAGFVAKAKGQQCIVMFKPNYPLRVVCDFGPYMAEIMLAPIVNPEY